MNLYTKIRPTTATSFFSTTTTTTRARSKIRSKTGSTTMQDSSLLDPCQHKLFKLKQIFQQPMTTTKRIREKNEKKKKKKKNIRSSTTNTREE